VKEEEKRSTRQQGDGGRRRRGGGEEGHSMTLYVLWLLILYTITPPQSVGDVYSVDLADAWW